MKLSTRSRYAVRAMLDLAAHHNGDPASREEIATRQGISPGYLARICGMLIQDGLIHGVRGIGGGYLLARSPRDVTIGDIVRAVEEQPLAPDCTQSEGDGDCPRAASCAARCLWKGLDDTVWAYLDSVTLEELSRQARVEEPVELA